MWGGWGRREGRNEAENLIVCGGREVKMQQRKHRVHRENGEGMASYLYMGGAGTMTLSTGTLIYVKG